MKIRKITMGSVKFTKRQFDLLVWPSKKEAFRIFTWCLFIVVLFTTAITGALDPLSIYLIKLTQGA